MCAPNFKSTALFVLEICLRESQIITIIIKTADMSWDSHVAYMLRKVSKRMYCIIYLVRAGLPTSDILCVYCSIIRSVLEYACPVWHPCCGSWSVCIIFISYLVVVMVALFFWAPCELWLIWSVSSSRFKHPIHNILPPVKVSNSQMTL